MDGEHHAVAKAVVATVAITGDHQAGGIECGIRIIVIGAFQCLPAVRCVTQPEARGDFAGEPSAFQVVDGARAFLQRRLVETRRHGEDLGQVGRFLAPPGLAGTLLARDIQAGIAGQLLDRVGERLPAIFHQEADGGAMSATAEAMVELLGGTDAERGRLLAVERAAGHVVGAGLLERDVAVDHLDDVDPSEQRLDEIVGDQEVRAGLKGANRIASRTAGT